jgi:tetratricopeptide (TPR) repeat protein
VNSDAIAESVGPLLLAEHHLGTRRPDRALEALERVDGICLELPEYWQLRAHAELQLSDYGAAVAAAEAGLTRQPDDPELLKVLALAQLELDHKRAALRAIDEAVSLCPDDATLRAHRAMILARSRRRPLRRWRLAQARREVAEALRLDPESPAALRARSLVAVLERDGRAGEYAAELVADNPQSAYAHLVTASALARRGRVSAAGTHVARAAALEPENKRLVWVARRHRLLEGAFFAPLLFGQRITRGHFRLVWFVTALVVLGVHQPALTVGVFAFWAYTWIAWLWLRVRIGKAPK